MAAASSRFRSIREEDLDSLLVAITLLTIYHRIDSG